MPSWCTLLQEKKARFRLGASVRMWKNIMLRFTRHVGRKRRTLSAWCRISLLLMLLSVASGFVVPKLPAAEELDLLSLSLRSRVSDATVLGVTQPEEFQEVDLAAHFRLPWQFNTAGSLVAGTRLMASAGIIRGVGKSGLVASLIPELAFASRKGSFVLDMGAGFALLSRYRFGTQDYGGPFQFALTAGVRVPLYRRLGLGYRFLHYSDAAVNGADTIGADFHMIEISYRF